MLTIAEVDSFLCNQLKFANWKEVIDGDKLEFIRLLVPYYNHNIYFQNITLSSAPEESRKVPDEGDIIHSGLNGIGGNCITQNTFLYLLLKALGFDAHIISGCVKSAGTNNENNHVLCVVRFNSEEQYLLDLGVGIPFPEPVPLHGLPYTHRAVGARLMYRKADNDLYECVQLDGALLGEEFENKDTEFIRYDFTLEPRTIEFFKEPLTFIFTDPERSIFLQFPILFRYFTEDENGEVLDDVQLTGDRKFILIRGDAVLIGTNETRLLKQVTDSATMEKTILKYFPRLSKESIETSLQLFNKNVKN